MLLKECKVRSVQCKVQKLGTPDIGLVGLGDKQTQPGFLLRSRAAGVTATRVDRRRTCFDKCLTRSLAHSRSEAVPGSVSTVRRSVGEIKSELNGKLLDRLVWRSGTKISSGENNVAGLSDVLSRFRAMA